MEVRDLGEKYIKTPDKNNREVSNPNHPKKGASIKVDPIKNLDDIYRIKKMLSDNSRNLCLFTMGINTAYRANELVSIKVGQVDYLKTGDRLELKQSKNKKYRAITLNKNVIASLKNWLQHHPNPKPDMPLFLSRKTGDALTSIAITNLVKGWCADIGLRGNFGSHTLRKTWGYQAYTNGADILHIQGLMNHVSQHITLRYIGVTKTTIRQMYFDNTLEIA